jgi:hypothetical protein
MASAGFTPGWSAEKFACEQIRGLVRRIFSAGMAYPVRHVVFSAVGSDIDIFDLCQRTGQTLAEERLGDVALVASEGWPAGPQRNLPLKQLATQIYRNYWSLPRPEYSEVGGFASVHTYLAGIRSDFEYSIVAAPAAGGSEATIFAQRADGIVLVLSAQNTRRASAARIKNALEEAGVRLLGTILMDREFPIPEKLYRRL